MFHPNGDVVEGDSLLYGRPTRVRSKFDSGLTCANIGCDYTEDEMEFILAMQTYQKEHKRKFPSYTEVLAVARSLGYVKRG